jgi:hypothetical protein
MALFCFDEATAIRQVRKIMIPIPTNGKKFLKRKFFN